MLKNIQMGLLAATVVHKTQCNKIKILHNIVQHVYCRWATAIFAPVIGLSVFLSGPTYIQLLWVHLKWTKCIYSMMSYEPAWISATMTNTETYKEQCNHPFDERWLQLPWKQRCYGVYTICYGPPYAETWYLKSNKSLSIRDTRAIYDIRGPSLENAL